MPLRVSKRELKTYQMTIDGGMEEVKQKKPRRRLEARYQELLFAEREEMAEKYPLLHFLFSTLNGIFIPKHLLDAAERAGLERGILDVWGPIRRAEYCGIVLDIKTRKNGPTEKQLEWAQHLVENGYRVYFPVGAVEAWWLICSYVGISGADHWNAKLQALQELAETLEA